jgi:hypothetical protein
MEPRERILPKRRTSLGWTVTEVGFESVPGYNYEAAAEGLSPQAIQTELHRNWLASIGKSVYADFDVATHVIDGLKYDPARPLVVGLDVPGTPAAVITQLDAFGRWCVLDNLAVPEDDPCGFYEFFEALAEKLLRKYCVPYGKELTGRKNDRAVLDVEFYGDPAGRAKIPKPGQSPKEVRSCYDILRDGIKMVIGIDEQGKELVEEKPGWGWHVEPGAVDETARFEAVRARLTTLLRGGIPAFAVDRSCRTLIEGLSGAYAFPQDSLGRYAHHPEKNFHSHVCNALEYPATRLFARAPKSPTDEWGEPTKHEMVSRSSARAIRGGR